MRQFKFLQNRSLLRKLTNFGLFYLRTYNIESTLMLLIKLKINIKSVFPK